MVHNAENHRVCGLYPSSGSLTKKKNISEAEPVYIVSCLVHLFRIFIEIGMFKYLYIFHVTFYSVLSTSY